MFAVAEQRSHDWLPSNMIDQQAYRATTALCGCAAGLSRQWFARQRPTQGPHVSADAVMLLYWILSRQHASEGGMVNLVYENETDGVQCQKWHT